MISEQEKEELKNIYDALDRIVFNSYLVWFGKPLRSQKEIDEDLLKAKRDLDKVCM